MRYRTPEAFRAALDQRLKNEATTAGVALMRLRKRVAFERFLARLAAVDSADWVLTGAFALNLRLGLGTRTTKDIDLARADDEQASTDHLAAAGAIDLGDFFDFEVRRTGGPEGRRTRCPALSPRHRDRGCGRMRSLRVRLVSHPTSTRPRQSLLASWTRSSRQGAPDAEIPR